MDKTRQIFHVNKEELKPLLMDIIERAFKKDGKFKIDDNELSFMVDETASSLKDKFGRLKIGDIQKAFDMGQNGDYDKDPSGKVGVARTAMKQRNIEYWLSRLIDDRIRVGMRVADQNHENNKKIDHLTDGLGKATVANSPRVKGKVFQIKLELDGCDSSIIDSIDPIDAGNQLLAFEKDENEKRERESKSRTLIRHSHNVIDTMYLKLKAYYVDKFNKKT